MFQPVTHADRTRRQPAHVTQAFAMLLVGEILLRAVDFVEHLVQVLHLVQEIFLVISRRHRDQHRHGDARQRGVDTRIIEQRPDDDGRNEVANHPFFAHTVHEQHARHDENRREQTENLHLTAIEECDDQDSAQVVGDGQRREEDLQRSGHAVAQHREDADGEGDICSRRDTPTVHRSGAGVEAEINQRRSQHTAAGSNDGQDGAFER